MSVRVADEMKAVLDLELMNAITQEECHQGQWIGLYLADWAPA